MKKRAKKIKTRMSSRAAEFEANLGQPNAKIIDAPNKAKIGKSIRDIDKLLGNLLTEILEQLCHSPILSFFSTIHASLQAKNDNFNKGG